MNLWRRSAMWDCRKSCHWNRLETKKILHQTDWAESIRVIKSKCKQSHVVDLCVTNILMINLANNVIQEREQKESKKTYLDKESELSKLFCASNFLRLGGGAVVSKCMITWSWKHLMSCKSTGNSSSSSQPLRNRENSKFLRNDQSN